MHTLLMLMMLAAPPFWESRPPAQWSEEEIQSLLHNSPWVQAARSESRLGMIPAVRVYLASAQPMRDAEEQLRLRRRKPGAKITMQDELDQDYLAFLAENPGKYIVLAVYLPNRLAMANAKEAQKMEEGSVLKVKWKRYRMVGQFPPTSSDPYLRLIYPRAVGAKDKEFGFDLYVPAVATPLRQIEFKVKDLLYKGQPEM
jgi:hypothetical protein